MKARAKGIMPPIQYWFTGTALATFIAFLAAVSTLGYGWYRAAITDAQLGTKVDVHLLIPSPLHPKMHTLHTRHR
jgi:hypothetical protein